MPYIWPLVFSLVFIIFFGPVLQLIKVLESYFHVAVMIIISYLRRHDLRELAYIIIYLLYFWRLLMKFGRPNFKNNSFFNQYVLAYVICTTHDVCSENVVLEVFNHGCKLSKPFFI